MLIVPELETVFIFVPRTGSGTLYRELKRVYPRSMLLYRHMEAEGCPRGYDRWRRVGFMRHPLCRLWSLYHFLKTFKGGTATAGKFDADAALKRRTVERPFQEWLLENAEPFTVPTDRTGEGNYWPVLTRCSAAPENKLSQFQYLRPDLGVEVLKFQDLHDHMERWGLDPLKRSNGTEKFAPPWSPEIIRHLETFCAWDIKQNCAEI